MMRIIIATPKSIEYNISAAENEILKLLNSYESGGEKRQKKNYSKCYARTSEILEKANSFLVLADKIQVEQSHLTQSVLFIYQEGELPSTAEEEFEKIEKATHSVVINVTNPQLIKQLTTLLRVRC